MQPTIRAPCMITCRHTSFILHAKSGSGQTSETNGAQK